MTKDIPEHILSELSRLVAGHTGLYFPEKKWNTLSKGIKAVIKDLDTDIHVLLRSLQASPDKKILNAITTRLSIGETYFLRDKNFFQILQDHILRGITQYPKRQTKKIVFWSAGCATGEEPYSLAIILDQMMPLFKDWDITIIASDINPAALQKAKKAIYSNWSLRGTPEKIIKHYFTALPGDYFELDARIREKVQFHQLNLMDGNYRASMNFYDTFDIILCRNVLMYFNEQSRTEVLRNLSNLLIDDGWLITGPAESGFINRPEFSSVRFPNALYHRKGPPRNSDENQILNHRRNNQQITSGQPVISGRSLKDRKKLRRISDSASCRRPEKPKYDIYQEALNDYNQGNYTESVEKLLALLANGQSNNAFIMTTDAMVLLAKSYANIGELEPARMWCEKAIASEKLNPENYYLLSTIFLSAGQLNHALKAMKQSIYLDPEFVMAHFSLGLLHLQMNMPAESKKSLQNALALLNVKDPEEILPYSEGITAARLIETIKSMKIS